MNKRIIGLALFIATFFLFVITGVRVKAVEENVVNVHFFHTTTCYNCKQEEEYLKELQTKYSNMVIIYYTMDDDNPTKVLENEELFMKIAKVFDVEEEIITPFTVIGGKSFIGYNDNIKAEINNYLDKYSQNEFVDVVIKIINNEEILPTDIEKDSNSSFVIPFFGEVDVKEFSLFVIAIVMGFIDGINPCAMWILLFLISMLIPTKDKKKIWLLGGTFLLTSGVFYFIIMMAWIKTVQIIAAKQFFLIAIGVFALIAGGYNVYRYIKSTIKKEVGCDVTDVDQKRKITTKIRKILNEKSILIALFGIIVLAITVNFIELACSAGLPVLFSQILSINEVSNLATLLYVIVYIIFFLIDDFIIFGIAVFTLKIVGVSNKFTKYSHLIGGILMLIIGILLLFFPNIIMFSF